MPSQLKILDNTYCRGQVFSLHASGTSTEELRLSRLYIVSCCSVNSLTQLI